MRSAWSRLTAISALGTLLVGALVLPAAQAAETSAHGGSAQLATLMRAGVAGRSRISPEALLRHSTRAQSRSTGARSRSGRPAAGRQPASQQPPGSDLGAPLPLGTLPLGTYVTNQFEKDGILFSGQSPFITNDGASNVNPTISGSPLFQGTVVGTFVKPGTTTPETVNDFSVVVGYIDNPGSTQMTVYDKKGKQLGVLIAAQQGFNQLLSTFPGAASFSVSSVADEPAGWEMNTIQLGPINTTYVALGDSYSSGEGTDDFPWSQAQGTQCDTGPEAWPVQMAAAQNTNSSGSSTLNIDQDTLVACQGETTSDLNVPVNGEARSELGQLTDFVSDDGPPDLVTITIGGNDLGFSDFLRACFLGGTEVCLHTADALDQRVTNGAVGLIATLASTYSTVKADAGDGTQVVVAGYPNLFPQPGGLGTALSVTYHCPWLRETASFLPGVIPVSPFLNTLLGTISDAQAAINDDMAVAAAEAGVPFIPIPYSLRGHELCTATPYINPLGLIGGITGDRNLGHPNVAGSAAIAAAVGSQLGLATTGGGGGGGGDGPARVAGRPAGSHRSGGTHRAAGPPHHGVRPADSGPLSFSGGQLADGTVGSDYIDYLVATGGTGADTWAITSGSLPPGLSLDQNAGTITGTPTASGTYTFTAQATDSSTPTPQTASSPVSITVDAASPLTVPTTALSDATVGQPYLSGLGATGGLGAVSWAITAGALPAGLHLNAATGQLTGTPAATAAGTSSFTVRATDSSSPAEVATAGESITVHPTSDPLTVTTSALPAVTAGQDYAGQLASTGGVGPVQWAVDSGSLPPGVSLDAATGVLSGTPTGSGTFDFTAQVTDATAPVSQTASADLSITINAPPPLSIATTAAFDGTEGSYYSSTLQATGGVGSYQWSVSSGSLPAGLSLDPASGQMNGVPNGTGDSSFSVTVSDAAGTTATRAYSVTIAQVTLDVSTVLAPATVGSYYAGNVSTSGGQAPYGWSLVSGTLPNGLSFDASTGAIVGTPQQSGTFGLQVAVTDSSAPSQQVTVSLTLTVAAAPPLQVSGRAPVHGVVGAAYTTGIGFSGGQGPYSWTVTAGALPPGLVLDPGSGMILGTPTAAGAYPVTVQVTDSSSPAAETASGSFTITVASPAVLAVASATLPGATEGTSYSTYLQATGGVAPYSWTVLSGSLPTGLLLYPYTGLIVGTPTGHGSKGLTVEVTDSASATAKRFIKLTVDKSSPLAVLTTSLDDATQGSSYSQTLTASGGVAPYDWTVLHGKLPAGLQLGATGEIVGMPTGFGSSTFTVKATDQSTPMQAAATQQLSIDVEAVPVSPPSFTEDSPYSPAGVGSSYGYQFEASGNPAPTFSVTSGRLPSGLRLAKDGVISGTPAHAGTYTFEVTATNGRTPDAVTPALDITVVPAPVINSFTPAEAVPGTQVVITGRNLENASYVIFTGSFATITSDTPDRIVTSVPEYAGSGPIYVYTPGGTAVSGSSFTVDPPPAPAITSISPTSGSAGSTLTITGTGLQFAYDVEFGGGVYAGSFDSDTATVLKLPVPEGVAAGTVTVFTDGGSATSTQTFTPTG